VKVIQARKDDMKHEAQTPLQGTQESKLLVIVATGKEDGGKRATLAFSAACCSAAMGSRTCVFLVGEGADWGYVGRSAGVSQPGFPPLDELMSSFVEIGGEGMICSACHEVCAAPDANTGPAVRRDGFRPAGLASVLAEFQGASALSF
jgi:predicted peroxiredoxin